MPSRAVPTSLDIGPAGPSLVGNLLAVESLQWFSYAKSHPVASVSPHKYVGVCCFLERTTFIMSVVVVVRVILLLLLLLSTYFHDPC